MKKRKMAPWIKVLAVVLVLAVVMPLAGCGGDHAGMIKHEMPPAKRRK